MIYFFDGEGATPTDDPMVPAEPTEGEEPAAGGETPAA